MALIKDWARQSFGPVNPSGFLQNVFNNIDNIGTPAFPGPFKLLRTEMEFVLGVHVPAAAGAPADWWIGSNVRLGLKLSPDGSNPGMTNKDESPEVLQMQLLIPEMSSDGSGTGAHSVTWRQPHPIDTPVMRDTGGSSTPAIYAYLWALDNANVLSGVFSSVSFAYSTQWSVLWGR